MSPKYLLALIGASILLLQAPIAFGCVDFEAYCYLDLNHGGEQNNVRIGLMDNGVVRCTGDGKANDRDGKRFDLSCSPGFSAIFDPNSGNVLYSPPWGHFEFGTTYSIGNYGDADDQPCEWYACMYGCNESTDCTKYRP